jgi:hypothetical protein
VDLATLAFLAVIGVQEGNPCQASLTTPVNNPNQLAFHIEEIDKLGVTTLEYLTFLQGHNEPQSRTKVTRLSLTNSGFINCFTLNGWVPPSNLLKDGKTQYIVVARTEDVNMRVSSWSAPSNPFTLGVPPIPDPGPLPLPVPGVRVGTSTP